MLDSLSTEARSGLFHRVRAFLADHGHDLAMAAAMLGGSTAEARVVAAAIRLETEGRIDKRIEADLAFFHRLLAGHEVGDTEAPALAPFSSLHPASPEVETICLLKDRLQELLSEIDAPGEHPIPPDKTAAAMAA